MGVYLQAFQFPYDQNSRYFDNAGILPKLQPRFPCFGSTIFLITILTTISNLGLNVMPKQEKAVT